jgi:hypothetical protein
MLTGPPAEKRKWPRVFKFCVIFRKFTTLRLQATIKHSPLLICLKCPLNINNFSLLIRDKSFSCSFRQWPSRRQQKIFFPSFSLLITFWRYMYTFVLSSKIKSRKEKDKTAVITLFLTIFAWCLKDPDPYLWLTDPGGHHPFLPLSLSFISVGGGSGANSIDRKKKCLSLLILGSRCLKASQGTFKNTQRNFLTEAIELFIEDQAFLTTSDMVPPLLPAPAPARTLPSKSSTSDTQKDWERETTCWQERAGTGGGGGGAKSYDARKPGLL